MGKQAMRAYILDRYFNRYYIAVTQSKYMIIL